MHEKPSEWLMLLVWLALIWSIVGTFLMMRWFPLWMCRRDRRRRGIYDVYPGSPFHARWTALHGLQETHLVEIGPDGPIKTACGQVGDALPGDWDSSGRRCRECQKLEKKVALKYEKETDYFYAHGD